jgi:hypothetical protein
MDLFLTSDCGDVFSIDTPSWVRLLYVAFGYGWQMAMTQPPAGSTEDDWSGTYISSRGQHVLAPDARGIAIALERFLLYPETIVFEVHPKATSWAQENKAVTTEVIRFCKNGGFRISRKDPEEISQGNATPWLN